MEKAMNFNELFLFIAIISVIGGIVSAVLITDFLKKNGKDANIIFWGFNFIRYLMQYKDITLKERGKTGPLFYSYLICFNLALLFALLGFLI